MTTKNKTGGRKGKATRTTTIDVENKKQLTFNMERIMRSILGKLINAIVRLEWDVSKTIKN